MAQVPLETFGGLVAAMRPSNLPEGASPRTYDTDFSTGSVNQRSGLQNVYSYSGSNVGPDPGFSAVNTSIGLTPWTNPTNILLNDGNFAVANLTSSSIAASTSAAGSSIGGGAPWTNPTNVNDAVSYATVSLATGGGGGTAVSSPTSGAAVANADSATIYDDEFSHVLGFASNAATSTTLTVTTNGTMNGLHPYGNGTINLLYSSDSGSTWNIARFWNNMSYSSTVVTIPISGITDINQVMVQMESQAQWLSGAISTIVAGRITACTATYPGGGGGSLTAQTLQAAISGISIPALATITGVEIDFVAVATGVVPSLNLSLSGALTVPTFTVTTAPAAYSFGNIFELWGRTWTPASFAGLVASFNSSSTGTGTLSINNFTIKVYYTLTGTASDYLDVTSFTFALPLTIPITGVSVTIKGFTSASQTLAIQLLDAGVALDPPKTVTLPTSISSFTAGGVNDAWGAALTPTIINDAAFGVRIQALGGGVASLDYITITIYTGPGLANFNYIHTFHAPTGIDYNLGLDALGNWWLENQATSPGIFTKILAGTVAGSFGGGDTVYNRAFVAQSQLTGQVQGIDIPRQYNFEQGWWDRITQVGPGAPPQFSAAETAGDIANITAFAVTSNIVTITAANAYTAGEVGTFSGLTAAAFLNGQTLNILSTGLSGTQFQVAAVHPNAGTTPDTGIFTPQYVYPISTITQPPQMSDPSNPGHTQALLWSSGPGSTSSGNVVTVYYSDQSVHSQPDSVLVAAFNAPAPVYVYIQSQPFGNGIWQVTSIGLATPPGGSAKRWYFTYQLPTSNYQFYGGPGSALGTYQITQGTITMAAAVPGLTAGGQVSISGTSVPAWDGVFPVVNSLNSGSFNITQSAISGGTATYTWALASGSAPVAGQLVTITNVLNANGILNVVDAVIATASGVSTGTFTINGFSPSISFGTVVEQGQATTAGTQFIIDPGAVNAGSTSINPILGNSTGGQLAIVGASVGGNFPIGPGIRQGVVMFITRNGLTTCPSPPMTFTVASGANYIQANQIPIGPPNVISRLVAFTEAGQNGVPGANFYTTTVPTIFSVNGTTYTSSSFLIPDNTTTSARFTFSDYVLLNSQAIDIPGNNLFNLIEIGNPAWIVQYADRTFYGDCQNRVNNFNNMSFDGGYLATSGGSLPLPLGWNADLNFILPQVRVSPIFGNSVYVQNTTGAPLVVAGLLTQSAYQDAYNVAILDSNTPYSVRITARSPSDTGPGALIVDLTTANQGVYGQTYAQYLLPLGLLNSTFATFTGPLTTGLTSIPSGLLLRVWGENLAAGGDFEIDRIEIFPTNQPVLTNQVWVSYPQQPEQVDKDTGQITLSSQSQDPVYGAFVMHGALYFEKRHSKIECEQVANEEPKNWSTRETSQRVGACGPNAFDYGDEWELSLDETGIFAFNGGIPSPVSRELQGFGVGEGLWDKINWAARQTFWLCNDLRARRFYVGVAMATPNFWLPLAPSNPAPTSPNVIIMCNYEGVPTFSEFEVAPSVHVTMFGNLKAVDMRRKWSIWNIASPYAAVVSDGVQNITTPFLCNGSGTGKIYRLIAAKFQPTDDGVPIHPLYTTYGFVGMEDGQQKGVGAGQKLATKLMADLEGSGSLQIRIYPNTLAATYPNTNPLNVQLQSPAQNNIERNFEARGQRLFYEYSMNEVGTPTVGYFELAAMMIEMVTHPFGVWRGVAK